MGFESLAATFGDVWPMLMSGLATTLQVTVISLVIAMSSASSSASCTSRT